MNNPFAVLESIDKRLSYIEDNLLNPPKKTENKLLSVKDLSEYSGLSELTIRNYIKEGKIKAKRIGRRILIQQSQFENGLSDVKSLKYKR